MRVFRHYSDGEDAGRAESSNRNEDQTKEVKNDQMFLENGWTSRDERNLIQERLWELSLDYG